MEWVPQILNKGKKASGQLSDRGVDPAKLRYWRFVLGICFLALVIYPMVLVEMATSHSGVDPDIDEITHELEKNPKNVDLLIKRGQLYRSNGELTESLNDLDRAEGLNPDNRRIILERGFTLSAMGRDWDAVVALDQYLEQASGRTRLDALAERAHIHARTGQADLAIADFTSAIRMHPAMALYLARGELHESLGHLDEAASGYREGLSQVGDAILLKKGLIRVETTRKRYDEVLKLIDDELDRASVKTEWHLRRAEVLAAMGKDQSAQSAQEQALAEANRVLGKRVTASHLVNRAKVYIAMGQLEQAEHELQLAVQRAPRFAEAKELLKKMEADKKTISSETSPISSENPNIYEEKN
jgi:tetratricopeptide (TPR) repeat protein